MKKKAFYLVCMLAVSNAIVSYSKAGGDGAYKYQECKKKDGTSGGECISANGDCSNLESCG